MQSTYWDTLQIELEFGNVGFWGEGKTGVPGEKTSQSMNENQQQTQPIHDAESGNQTRATLVGGECSQHSAIPACQADNLEYCKTKVRSPLVSWLTDILFSSASGKIDDQIFINKNISAPGVLRFHPYEPYLAVADRGGVRYVVLYFIAT